MLTGFQATVIAFITDGEIVCSKHIEEQHPDLMDDESLSYWETYSEIEERTGYSALSRYSLEEGSEGRGEWCGTCGAELVEQSEDYCTEHDGWRSSNEDGEPSQSCEYGEEPDLAGGGEECRFPDTDPNPPAARWVPCSVCGAGDGEPHDTSKHLAHLAPGNQH